MLDLTSEDEDGTQTAHMDRLFRFLVSKDIYCLAFAVFATRQEQHPRTRKKNRPNSHNEQTAYSFPMYKGKMWGNYIEYEVFSCIQQL